MLGHHRGDYCWRGLWRWGWGRKVRGCGRRVRRRRCGRLCWWWRRRRRRDRASRRRMWRWGSRLGSGLRLRGRRRRGLRFESRRRRGLRCGCRHSRPCWLGCGLRRWRWRWKRLGATLECGLSRRWRTRWMLGVLVGVERIRG